MTFVLRKNWASGAANKSNDFFLQPDWSRCFEWGLCYASRSVLLCCCMRKQCFEKFIASLLLSGKPMLMTACICYFVFRNLNLKMKRGFGNGSECIELWNTVWQVNTDMPMRHRSGCLLVLLPTQVTGHWFTPQSCFEAPIDVWPRTKSISQ